ncbi:conserved hypothetical protein, partial [Trichinella spiralis]|uniref:hypothetical protein n=1 Tax=Trichinella spiralis TaxID=6334 RepID=UPI0001EFE280
SIIVVTAMYATEPTDPLQLNAEQCFSSCQQQHSSERCGNGTAIETKAKLFITITSSTSRVYCSLLLKTTNSITVGSKTFANVARDADRPKVHRAFIRQRTQRRLILVKIAPSAPSVCLSTVSRPVELSLQSSFQLSLAVLVRYRSRTNI